MRRQKKSLRGIACYSLCFVLAISVLTYSIYQVFSDDEPSAATESLLSENTQNESAPTLLEDKSEPEGYVCVEDDTDIQAHDTCIPEHGEDTFDEAEEIIIEEEPQSTEPKIIQNKVQAGDSVGKILNEYLSVGEVHNLLQITNPHYKLSNIRVGQRYTLTLSPDATVLTQFSYEVSNTKVLHVEVHEDKTFSAELVDIIYDYELAHVEGHVESSLYGSVIDTGETIALGATLADIFGWEIDFIHDIRQGDSFTALVEKRYRDGEFKGYGRVLSATYTNGNRLYEAFRFIDEHGDSAFYDREGRSLRKAFLKAPLNFTRISSPYTLKRYHPILKKNRPHQGIDYAAPTGTPVKTVGDGTVVFKGWMNGYGNIVRIKHVNNIETMYAHLSKFAKGLQKGQRVRQGEVIAYVGSTGLSTGPHLDFRVRKDGEFVNPSMLLNPRSNPVPKAKKAAFAERIELLEQLQNSIGESSYLPELVLDK